MVSFEKKDDGHTTFLVIGLIPVITKEETCAIIFVGNPPCGCDPIYPSVLVVDYKLSPFSFHEVVIFPFV